jgi:cytochrome c-type biogenesis protein CcmH/NrfG
MNEARMSEAVTNETRVNPAKIGQSPSTPNSNGVSWTSTQAYVLAAFCLLLGVALGYLFCGSAPTATTQAASTMQPAGSQQGRAQQGRAQQDQADPAVQAALAQAAAPLLDAVNKDPKDFDSLVKLGNLYYDGKQFPGAIQYYERALAIHPENPDVRTDMGTAYWYTGDAEKALAAMETSLKYQPGHPQTLFNLGWVRWQGKQDPKGAIEAWQQLLKANPDYPQKQQVEQYIAKAREHASRG